ncbi:MAG: aspartyl-tRNA(Asn)/glutamyl-tRNA(Gln) amidotransferase subunit [Frankiaceae bacterium]|nr:aspartyl-tRNA(Asn)/glutamyl-tRNA(Gln) amidotransferase subunit [Frankiaceae bacterium]
MTTAAPSSGDLRTMGAVDTAQLVRTGRASAVDVVGAAINRIAAQDGVVNSVTAVTADRALRAAEIVDAMLAAGIDPGPLAGVPFGVKDLFDVRDVTTLAGSKIYADRAPALADAAAVVGLESAGAILVATLRMDEFAYGFTTENSHYGPTRNPHDLRRVAGGSSGGSAAAVAAGLLPLTLGSDTNGSIRVPAALCGIFSLKPTYGRLSRAGMAPFVDSLDTVGLMARSVDDLRAALDALDPRDGAPEPRVGALRVAVAGGYFATGGTEQVMRAVAAAASALDAHRVIASPLAAHARAAAMLVTAAEGGQAHLDDLRQRGRDFDPMTRERFLAGALLPAAAYLQAQRFRSVWRAEMDRLMSDVDVLIVPATPFPAPYVGEREVSVGGRAVLTAPNLGLYAQPLSFIGLPVVTAPVHMPGEPPVGVQLVARPHREADALHAAAVLETAGIASAPVAAAFTVPR